MEKELEWAASALAAAFGSDGGCGAGETAVSAADMVRWGECSTGPIVFFFFLKESNRVFPEECSGVPHCRFISARVTCRSHWSIVSLPGQFLTGLFQGPLSG